MALLEPDSFKITKLSYSNKYRLFKIKFKVLNLCIFFSCHRIFAMFYFYSNCYKNKIKCFMNTIFIWNKQKLD